jgi:hypothetical protein
VSNYLDHPGAGPLDGLLLSFFPTVASDGQPFDAPEPQHIPGVESGMKQFLWEWDHRDGMDAEHLVEKYGVRVSGRIVPKRENDLVGFSVPDHHAQWAEYILLRAGYPLVTPLVNPAHARLLERSWHTGPSTGHASPSHASPSHPAPNPGPHSSGAWPPSFPPEKNRAAGAPAVPGRDGRGLFIGVKF